MNALSDLQKKALTDIARGSDGRYVSMKTLLSLRSRGLITTSDWFSKPQLTPLAVELFPALAEEGEVYKNYQKAQVLITETTFSSLNTLCQETKFPSDVTYELSKGIPYLEIKSGNLAMCVYSKEVFIMLRGKSSLQTLENFTEKMKFPEIHKLVYKAQEIILADDNALKEAHEKFKNDLQKFQQ